jgi:transglutaminase-like putative cysteine protease
MLDGTSMRFGSTHRAMTGALAAFAMLGLLSSGRLDGSVSLALLAALALAVSKAPPTGTRLRHARTAVVLALLGAAAACLRLHPGSDLVDVLVTASAALQVVRLATRDGAVDDQQVTLMALLHLVAGTFLGSGFGYGLCLLGVLVVAPGALLLSHLRREVEANYRQGARDRTGLPVDVPRILRSRRVVDRSLLGVTCLLSIPILLVCLVFFAVVPRPSMGLRSFASDVTLFRGIDLGPGAALLRRDPALAARVRVPHRPDPPARLALHLRATAYDTYDGRAWSESTGTGITERHASASGPPTMPTMRIDLEPVDPPLVFLPLHASAISTDGTALRAGPEGELRSPSSGRRVSYDVTIASEDVEHDVEPALSAADRARYLALPHGLTERVRALATAWTAASATPLERAHAIEHRLKTEYRYDREAPSALQPEPLDHFLFEAKRGHCQYYATAMAVLLRAVGVPTRNVTGFAGGSYNRFGHFYAVRRSDAHAWVEAFIDGRGWMTFDPTPAAEPRSGGGFMEIVDSLGQGWDQHVTWYDHGRRASLLGSLTPGSRHSRMIVAALVAFVVGLAVAAFASRRRPSPARGANPYPAEPRSASAEAAVGLYEHLDTAMVACGRPRAPGTPPLRHAEAVAASGDNVGREILGLTHAYLAVRFGGVSLTSAERADLERRVRELGERATRERDARRRTTVAPMSVGDQGVQGSSAS